MTASLYQRASPPSRPVTPLSAIPLLSLAQAQTGGDASSRQIRAGPTFGSRRTSCRSPRRALDEPSSRSWARNGASGARPSSRRGRGRRPPPAGGRAQPPRLRVARVEVDDDEQDVRAVRARLAVGDELVVINLVEAQRVVALQGGVLAPDAVHLGDEAAEAGLVRQVPVLDLVLLGVQVLLAARLQGLVEAPLVGGAVDAVAR